MAAVGWLGFVVCIFR